MPLILAISVGTADEWKAWARAHKLTVNDLVPLSTFLSANGEVEATLRKDQQLAKIFTELDSNSAFPGFLENKGGLLTIRQECRTFLLSVLHSP